MKIAILGSGYVGTALANHWKHAGHTITLSTRSPAKAAALAQSADRVQVLHGADITGLIQFLKDQEALILCQAADSQAAYEETYLGTAKALTAVLPHDPQLKHIIYTSSTSVYGEHQGAMVDETTPLIATHTPNQYLIAAEEHLFKLSNPSCSVCILRLGEIHGPGRQIADRLKKMQGQSLPGTGDSITNLTHLDDIVGACDFALKQRLSGIFNLCSDLHIPRRELYALICAQENLPLFTWDPSKKNIHASNKIVSNAKIKAAGYTLF